MKHIIIFATFMLFYSQVIIADTQNFVEINAQFHKLSTDDINNKNKIDSLCINCHLLEDNNDSATKWLRPQETINTTIKNIEDKNGDPDSFSKACLSCHDGSQASLVLNAPLSPCGLKNLAPISPNGANHPVFMEYENKQGLHPQPSILQGDWKDAQKVSDLLRDEKMVCISCHTPHHSKSTRYLKASMRGSRLCMGCHNK